MCNDHSLAEERSNSVSVCNDHRLAEERSNSVSVCNDHRLAEERSNSVSVCNDHRLAEERSNSVSVCNDHCRAEERSNSKSLLDHHVMVMTEVRSDSNRVNIYDDHNITQEKGISKDAHNNHTLTKERSDCIHVHNIHEITQEESNSVSMLDDHYMVGQRSDSVSVYDDYTDDRGSSIGAYDTHEMAKKKTICVSVPAYSHYNSTENEENGSMYTQYRSKNELSNIKLCLCHNRYDNIKMENRDNSLYVHYTELKKEKCNNSLCDDSVDANLESVNICVYCTYMRTDGELRNDHVKYNSDPYENQHKQYYPEERNYCDHDLNGTQHEQYDLQDRNQHKHDKNLYDQYYTKKRSVCDHYSDVNQCGQHPSEVQIECDHNPEEKCQDERYHSEDRNQCVHGPEEDSQYYLFYQTYVLRKPQDPPAPSRPPEFNYFVHSNLYTLSDICPDTVDPGATMACTFYGPCQVGGLLRPCFTMGS